MRGKKGMTLVEVVVATCLIALGVIVLLGVAAQTAVFSERSDRGYAATNLAIKRMEMLKRLDYDMLPLAEESDVRVGADGNISTSGKFFRTTEMTENFNGNSYLMRVKVTVRELKVNADGSVPGTVQYQGSPVVIETLFVDM